MDCINCIAVNIFSVDNADIFTLILGRGCKTRDPERKFRRQCCRTGNSRCGKRHCNCWCNSEKI